MLAKILAFLFAQIGAVTFYSEAEFDALNELARRRMAGILVHHIDPWASPLPFYQIEQRTYFEVELPYALRSMSKRALTKLLKVIREQNRNFTRMVVYDHYVLANQIFVEGTTVLAHCPCHTGQYPFEEVVA